jgi:glycopeptide antibiotics resistance protein
VTGLDHRHLRHNGLRRSRRCPGSWLAAAGSILVELSQYVLRLERVSSVDDVLLNTAGAGLAALASRQWWRVRTLSPSV